MSSTLLNITRQQLAQVFNNDPRLIKAFEELFKKTYVDTPSQIDDGEAALSSNSVQDVNQTIIDSVIMSLVPLIYTAVSEFVTATGISDIVQNEYTPPFIEDNEVVSRVPILLRSTVNLTNFSSGATATLTNAPIAGNPTKWVSINDNGIIRYIPTW